MQQVYNLCPLFLVLLSGNATLQHMHKLQIRQARLKFRFIVIGCIYQTRTSGLQTIFSVVATANWFRFSAVIRVVYTTRSPGVIVFHLGDFRYTSHIRFLPTTTHTRSLISWQAQVNALSGLHPATASFEVFAKRGPSAIYHLFCMVCVFLKTNIRKRTQEPS